MRTLTANERQLIRDSGLFDYAWYAEKYRDVAATGLDPLEHFLRIGIYMGREPGPLFDSKHYCRQLEQFDTGRSAGILLCDYLELGWREGLNPNPLFDVQWYLNTYSDIKMAGVEPLSHYALYGAFEGRNPHRFFNSGYVMAVNPELLTNKKNALAFYLGKEWKKDPFPDATRYLKENTINFISCEKKFNIVPIYLNSIHEEVEKMFPYTIGVHLHLYYIENLNKILEYLLNIDRPFSLYISIPIGAPKIKIQERILESLTFLSCLVIEEVPNRGRDIAPLIIQFGSRLLSHDFICHIHTKKTPYHSSLFSWGERIFNNLLGSKAKVNAILSLLNKDAKFIFPEEQEFYAKDPSGWGDNFTIANNLLSENSKLKTCDFPEVVFPEGSMFWCTRKAARNYLTIPLSWSDFPDEPISQDGTLGHALERLPLLLAQTVNGINYKVLESDVDKNRLFYERQLNFKDCIEHSSVKVLAYYLPQFHPTPENDEWHGPGFTEWTKVTASSPLFEGHYQQHIPHNDIGHYVLEDTNVMKKQAAMMQSAGVHGMIFYHYWFSGRLILEKPARMLLSDKTVEMPFCFCWANENWTRRWDGNEDEILLKQTYNRDDARAFIQYLIPFFKDSRYIRVDDRPVVYIYRPSSIPIIGEYISEWKQECAKVGLKEPYLVAVLTRGAINPNEYGFDAGVERVLHDWTDGNVDDIRGNLSFYNNFNGHIIDYDGVAKYYTTQFEKKPFTYFRSIVPQWDNTARYREEAYIVHNSSPKSFQCWLESIIRYTKDNLPEDRQFIVINAWNEWAEGAHLEPDTAFGYAYLNSVGRALASIPYSHKEFLNFQNANNLQANIKLEIAPNVMLELLNDSVLLEKFNSCLTSSTLFKNSQINVYVNQEIFKSFKLDKIPCIKLCSDLSYDLIIQFRRSCVFGHSALERMINMAICEPHARVVCNTYDSNHSLIRINENLSINRSDEFLGAIVVISPLIPSTVKACPMANAFVSSAASFLGADMPDVTTIIRFHRSNSLEELENALLCLYAMYNVNVKPWVGAQDLDEQQKESLNKLLNKFKGFSFVIRFFESNTDCPDMRSKMLNQGFCEAATRYVGFLDYDDLLMPHAYDYLITRLSNLNKAISFGRVFATQSITQYGILLARSKKYEYNYSYHDFIRLNHAPIHSFLIDKELLSKKQIHYYDYHVHMEDYYMMLQLVTADNTDWESLKLNFYIGDYIHAEDRSNTSATFSQDKVNDIISSQQYEIFEQRINDLRYKLSPGGLS